ncbi:MAG: GntR family transcriptional regulator [Oscillospiraceae bacterium]
MAKSPKYVEIIRWCREQIDGGAYRPGDRFLSEKELGDRFDISRQTVRHALDLLENDGVIRRVRGSGTFIADGNTAPGRKTMTVGVVSTYLDDYIFPSILQGIESVLTQEGYAIHLASTYNKAVNEARALQAMMDNGVDGLIVEPTKSGLPSINMELYRQIQLRRIPLVFFNAYYPALTLPYVALDDEQAGLLAARHLIRSGHKKVAGIFLLDDIQGHLRYSGYTKAIAEAGMDLMEDRNIWYTTEDKPYLFTRPEYLLSRLGDSTGVFCYNDQLAFQLIAFLRSQGLRVPQDISVIGIDNSDMASLSEPPLTTIAHPMRELGVATAELLTKMLGGGLGKTRLFPPELIVRGSVAVPKE